MNNNFDPDYPQVKRTYTPEEAGHERTRRPVKRHDVRRSKKIRANPGVVILSVIFAAIFALTIYILVSGKYKSNLLSSPSTTTELSADNAPAENVTTDDGLPYFTITVPESSMYYGDLILVNSKNEYRFPATAEKEIIRVTEKKNAYYGVSDSSCQLSEKVIGQFNTLCWDFYNYNGFEWLQVNSAYRSKEEQTDLYAQYSKDYGEDYAKAYVATPGFSEHHTGIAMDINVKIDDSGTTYPVESYEGCEWFRENAVDYGFVLRYPEDKVEYTGINFESWHYRYVGTPHSYIMNEKNLCLEEYINSFLVNYTYDTVCLGYDSTKGAYDITSPKDYDGGVMIYYAPKAGEETQIKIPKNSEYTVSGNNVSGFIVTVTGK